MPPQRTPFCDIDSNRRYKGPELSPYQKGQIIGARKAGSSPKEIEGELGHSREAVRKTLESIHIRDKGYTLPRSGTPLKYTSRARRRMLQCLWSHPKMSYEKRREATGLKMSDSYIRHLAIAKGLKHWRARKRPELTPVVAAERLLWYWCRAY
jgi:hypothetical protein